MANQCYLSNAKDVVYRMPRSCCSPVLDTKPKVDLHTLEAVWVTDSQLLQDTDCPQPFIFFTGTDF